MSREYVQKQYRVPANIGCRVIINGKTGIITADRGNYIGVNFDTDKPTVIYNVHPTDGVTYQGMATLRPLTRSQRRYQHYMEVADLFHNFSECLKFKGWETP